MLGDQLEYFRKFYGFSPVQIAKLLGVECIRYFFYEVNRDKPDQKGLETLSKLFNVPINVLTFGDPRYAGEQVGTVPPEENFEPLSATEKELIFFFRRWKKDGEEKAAPAPEAPPEPKDSGKDLILPDSCCENYAERHSFFDPQKNCWYCRYADFGLNTSTAKEKGVCCYPEVQIE